MIPILILDDFCDDAMSVSRMQSLQTGPSPGRPLLKIDIALVDVP